MKKIRSYTSIWSVENIVAHRLSTVRGADRILVIGQGRIREQGSYQELMAKKGEFYQMEQLQRMVR